MRQGLRVNVVRKNFFSVLVLILTYDTIRYLELNLHPCATSLYRVYVPHGKHLVDNRRRVVFVFACCAGTGTGTGTSKKPGTGTTVKFEWFRIPASAHICSYFLVFLNDRHSQH